MPRRSVITAVAAAVLLAGCGSSSLTGTASQTTARRSAAAPAARTQPSVVSHPQAVEPVAGDAGGAAAAPPSEGAVSVGPAVSGTALPQPASLTSIKQELAASGLTANLDQATLTAGGLAVAPVDAPTAVQQIIAAGNAIARLPYRYGGGHATYEDTAYDCSGSISYVFAAAHLLDHTVTSGELENWGDAGPGKWITVFANAGHTFMYVAGLRFDTVALAETGSRWSARSADEPDLSSFSVRHPPGL
jgi:cell wall-associated NlpC family hydrolase